MFYSKVHSDPLGLSLFFCERIFVLAGGERDPLGSEVDRGCYSVCKGSTGINTLFIES